MGRIPDYEYDTAGRVTRQTLPDGREIRYGYDANGNLTSLMPPGQPAHTFSYTPINLLAQYTPPDVGIGNTSTQYAYNADKQLTQVTRPDGQMLSYEYDNAGRLSTLTLPGRAARLWLRRPTGKLTSISAPDGTLSYSYNGSLLAQTSWSGTIAGQRQPRPTTTTSGWPR